MITALLRDGDWSQEELDGLKAEIDRMHAEGKKR